MPENAPETSPAPLVSVVLNSYNYGRYVRQAMESVFAQCYRPLELIVVDDGSTDDSKAVIEGCAARAPIPTTLLFKENGGQASALNAGFAQAKGTHVFALDSDDYWMPDKIQQMMSFALSLPDAGLYQHQLRHESGGLDKDLLISGDLAAVWRKVRSVNMALPRHLGAVFVPTTGLGWRAEVLQRILPIPERLVTCADAYLTRMACLHGPLYSHPEPLGVWRDHGGNAGRQGQYGFHRYWLPVVRPALNAALIAAHEDIRFVYHPSAQIAEPWLELQRALLRRLRSGTRKRV